MNKKELHIISHLIRNRFDSLAADELATSAPDLIYTARSLGLNDLAHEMQADLSYCLPKNLQQSNIATTI